MEKTTLPQKIRQISNLIRYTINAQYGDLFPKDLTGFQGLLVRYIFRHPDKDVSSQDLATFFHLSKSTVSEAVSSLKKNGYVKMTSSKKDARVKSLTLTEKALKSQAKIQEGLIAFDIKCEEGIGESDKEAFDRVFQAIKKNLGEKSDEDY